VGVPFVGSEDRTSFVVDEGGVEGTKANNPAKSGEGPPWLLISERRLGQPLCGISRQRHGRIHPRTGPTSCPHSLGGRGGRNWGVPELTDRGTSWQHRGPRGTEKFNLAKNVAIVELVDHLERQGRLSREAGTMNKVEAQGFFES